MYTEISWAMLLTRGADDAAYARQVTPGAGLQGPFLGSQLTAEESQTAAVAFGANSSTLVYSSPMLQNKLLLFDFVQGTALQYISMQHHVRVLTGPLQGSSAAFADAEGLIGLVNLYSGSIIELEGMSTLHVFCCTTPCSCSTCLPLPGWPEAQRSLCAVVAFLVFRGP